jgi:uncharacterized membrane protein YphA (DoxX/SURF4 family)
VQVDVTAGVAGLFVRNPGWYQMFDMRLYESMDVRVFLYLAIAGGGVWSLDHLRAGNKTSRAVWRTSGQ